MDEKNEGEEDSFMIMNDGKAIFRYISFSLVGPFIWLLGEPFSSGGKLRSRGCWKQQSRKALNRLETDFSNKKKSKQAYSFKWLKDAQSLMWKAGAATALKSMK